MPDLDEFLKRELRRTIAPVDVNDVSSRIDLRRSRRERLRKVQAVGLTVIVLAGTVGGVAMLSRAFRGSGPGIGAVPDVRNGVIVYSEVRNAGQLLLVANPDGSGVRQLTSGQGVSDSSPSVSPDGLTVAFERTDGSGSSIFTIGIDGAGLAEFSPDDASGLAPSWSPDGALLAYAGADGGIFVMDVEGSDPRLIVDRTFVAVHLTWSPDGTRMAFAAASAAAGVGQSNYDLWITDVTDSSTSTPVNITGTSDASELSPSWSPDGSQILFSSDALRGSSLFAMSPDPDASPVALTGGTTTDQNPTWSPDGTRIVFDRATPAGTDIFTSRPDGSDLTLVAHNAIDPAWQAVPSDLVPSPSPTVGSHDDLGLGFPVCNVRTLGGDAARDLAPDFDGNGIADTAYVATKRGDAGGCPQGVGTITILGVDLTGDGGIDAEYGPISCELDCKPFLALDLDGDGADELLVQQLGGAVLGLVPYLIVGFGEVAADGPGIGELVVAPPGDPEDGLVPGGPLTFYLGGDEGFSAALGCRGSGADRVLIATTGQLDSIEQPTTWAIRRTTFRLTSQGFDVVDTETFDQPVDDVLTPGSQQETSLCGIPFPPNPVFETP